MVGPNGMEQKRTIHDNDCDLWVTMVGWVDVPYSGQGVSRYWCSIHTTSYTLGRILHKSWYELFTISILLILICLWLMLNYCCSFQVWTSLLWWPGERLKEPLSVWMAAALQRCKRQVPHSRCLRWRGGRNWLWNWLRMPARHTEPRKSPHSSMSHD